jgi:hypothetical protein
VTQPIKTSSSIPALQKLGKTNHSLSDNEDAMSMDDDLEGYPQSEPDIE